MKIRQALQSLILGHRLSDLAWVSKLWRLLSILLKILLGRSQWPRGLRRGSASPRLLGLWVWILPRAWMVVSCKCCVLSSRGLCAGLITRPEESYRVWSWILDNVETLAHWGLLRPWLKKVHLACCYYGADVLTFIGSFCTTVSSRKVPVTSHCLPSRKDCCEWCVVLLV